MRADPLFDVQTVMNALLDHIGMLLEFKKCIKIVS